MALSAAQTILTGYDVALQRQWRTEDRGWRAEDLEWRAFETNAMHQEQAFMRDERDFMRMQMEQSHLDNARAIWQRFLERNRREVAEKTEQLKALSFVATLLAGFATEAILQFSYDPAGHDALVALLAFTTACIIGLELACVVLCCLMLVNALRVGASFVSEEEEAEFMHKCKMFLVTYKLGDRPPAPARTFSAHWARRCEREWRTAFMLFLVSVPMFFFQFTFAAWLKFQQTTSAAAIMTGLMGVGMLYNFYIHRTWGRHLLQDEDEQELAAERLRLRPMGLPFDWHLVAPPAQPQARTVQVSMQAADAPMCSGHHAQPSTGPGPLQGPPLGVMAQQAGYAGEQQHGGNGTISCGLQKQPGQQQVLTGSEEDYGLQSVSSGTAAAHIARGNVLDVVHQHAGRPGHQRLRPLGDPLLAADSSMHSSQSSSHMQQSDQRGQPLQMLQQHQLLPTQAHRV